jgi:uncharacterized protein DUF5050/CHAP domain-containing protein/fibronectin type III domain protein
VSSQGWIIVLLTSVPLGSQMFSKRKPQSLSLIVALSVLIIGCGSSGSVPPSNPQPPTPQDFGGAVTPSDPGGAGGTPGSGFTYEGVVFSGECVGSVRRYYSARYNIAIPFLGSDGGAFLLWNNIQPSASVMTRIPHTGNIPVVHDMVIWDHWTSPPFSKDNPFGHVAVVAAVNGNNLTVVDSNWCAQYAGCMHTVPLDDSRILGWYHPIVTPGSAPTTPNNLSAIPVSPSEIDLAWTDTASDEDGFRVESSTNGVTYATAATLGSSTMIFHHTSLLPSTTYFYRVVAFKAGVDSIAALSSATTLSIPTGPLTLADSLNRPWSVAVTSSSVYWTEDSLSGSIKMVPITGGPITTLVSNLIEPAAITVDDSFVYWMERNNGDNGSIKKISLNGGSSSTLVTGLHNAQNFLAIDQNFLYFGDGQLGGGGAIRKVAKAGGAVTTLVSGLINLTPAIAVDASFVYYTDGLGSILRVPISGGTSSIVATGIASGLTVNGSNLYWTDFNAGTVNKVSVAGGLPIILASGSNSPFGLATDGINIYWTEFTNPGSVRKVSVNGGPSTMISANSNTVGIAVDSNFVYWAENVFVNAGKIKRAPK